MDKRIKLNWHRSVNFGDQLNPYLAKKIWGMDSIKIDEGNSDIHLMMIGSILNEANSNSIVFGSGFVSEESFFSGNPKILSVRGELTRNILKSRGYSESEIKIGDPAILIPDFYQPKVSEKKYKIGIIPHIIDYEIACNLFSDVDDCLIINLRLSGENEEKEIEEIIDMINSCDCITSSSLHGLIIAHSYGIPGSWCEFSDRVLGNGFKFQDYFSAHSKSKEFIDRLDFKGIDKLDSLENLIEISSSTIIKSWEDKEPVYEIIRDINNGNDLKKVIC